MTYDGAQGTPLSTCVVMENHLSIPCVTWMDN